MAAAPLIAQQDMAVLPATLPTLDPFIWVEGDNHVNLTLSSGETVFVGTVQALHQLATTMLRNGQHLVCPSEEIFIALAGPAAKIVIGEMSFQNQKLIKRGCFVYAQGRLEVWSRCGSCIHSLDEALQCVGHYRTIDHPYATTADLLAPVGAASPRHIVVDWRFDPAHPERVTFVDAVPFNYRPRL
jgi:hypothetical protein